MRSSSFFSTLSLTLVALLISTAAQAQVYKWKDSQGRTVISDTPQPGAGPQTPVVGGSAPKVSTTTPQSADKPATPAAPTNWAEKELDLKKRMQDRKESEQKEAQAKLDAERKAENCKRSQDQLAIMESGERLVTYGANGEREYIDDARREAEVARARKAVEEWCK
ncbi:MAG: DUF4124 domain-containing protein [Azovibrio sp.]